MWNTHLEKICLEVGAHHSSGNADYQGREWIEATPITRRLRDDVTISARGSQGCGGYRSKPTSQATRFETHPNHSCKPEHDGDTYMLNLLVGIGVARVRAETFHPRIGYPVKKDYQRLDKFRGDTFASRSTVPCPTKFGERSEETRKCNETVAPENATLCVTRNQETVGKITGINQRTNNVGQAPIHIAPATPASIDDDAMHQLREASKDQEPLQSPKQELAKAVRM
jgi:hypothetical protein